MSRTFPKFVRDAQPDMTFKEDGTGDRKAYAISRMGINAIGQNDACLSWPVYRSLCGLETRIQESRVASLASSQRSLEAPLDLSQSRCNIGSTSSKDLP